MQTNLTYITRVNLPSSAAQSKQILAMSKEFSKILGNNFHLISGVTISSKNDTFEYRELEKNSTWTKISLPNLEFMKQTFYFFYTFIYCKKKSSNGANNIIYTRDLVVAISSLIFGNYTIYEAHKEPKSVLAYFLFKLGFLFRNFKIIAVSGALSNYFITEFRIKKKIILVAHDGADVNVYNNLRMHSKNYFRNILKIEKSRLLIIHTGSLRVGVSDFLFKISTISPPKALIIHIGGQSNICASLNSKCKDFGLSNLIFIPQVNGNISRYYQCAADLLIFYLDKKEDTSWCASPLKVFEYMATGNPIFASFSGSASEVLNNSNAFLFSPEFTLNFESTLNDSIFNKTKRDRLSSKAYFDVSNHYSWEKRATQILNFTKSFTK
jgi:glycosyltransferase involved in cell wall biosynthesis